MKIFISDVHLGFYNRIIDKKREDILLNMLKNNINKCEKLYILGDLFDYWFDYKEVIPKNFYRILSLLNDYREQGIPILYVMGNHDFGHYKFFKEELDIEVVKNDTFEEIDGKKFYFSHGDGKNNQDFGYLLLKKVLRNNFCQKIYRFLHPNIGIFLASKSSKTSRKHSNNKHNDEYSKILEFAFEKLDNGFDYVVMGHTHKAEIIKHNNGKYINLGEWLDKPIYGVYENNSFSLIEL